MGAPMTCLPLPQGTFVTFASKRAPSLAPAGIGMVAHTSLILYHTRGNGVCLASATSATQWLFRGKHKECSYSWGGQEE